MQKMHIRLFGIVPYYLMIFSLSLCIQILNIFKLLSLSILPDLVRFQGFIRIHRRHGTIQCPIPFKVRDDQKLQNNENVNDEDQVQSSTPNGNTDNISNDETDDKKDENEMNHKTKEEHVDPKHVSKRTKSTNWLGSLSNFAKNATNSVRKLQTLMDHQSEVFESTFPVTLKDAAIHQTELESYILENDRFFDLFAPISSPPSPTISNEPGQESQPVVIPLNEQWEFCPVKIHHETLYIRYAKKWITLSLKDITIAPLTLKTSDCTPFIVDYQVKRKIEKSAVITRNRLDFNIL